ncbi:CoA transferase [Dokdonella sp.]|uniref:CoA transferase n=1 Tax=Dokdonella sp. TaxID=2291710 RepID=UPI001B0E3927|nr:CoA transferase [Dokdonella sp.]MBO9664204.1 CoA transferase [Dokdonella sp.]
MSIVSSPTNSPTDRLSGTLRTKLSQPATDSAFDLHGGVDEVLGDVGMRVADLGGTLSFYGADPILPSPIRFGTMSAIGLAAKTVAAATLFKERTGIEQDVHVDVRKALRRFCCFFEGKWELINGRPPAMGADEYNPFVKMPLFHETRDGRHVLPLNFYPALRHRTLNFLRCSDSTESVRNAVLQWNALELENAAAERGIVLGMVRTNEEFRRERQYSEVLSKMPLVQVEKIGESEPMPFSRNAVKPLEGIRAMGFGHVIAGAAIGRDLALYGADVLNVWRPNDTEIESFFWTTQVGMRSTVLGDAPEDRRRFRELIDTADVFFANKRPGFLRHHGMDAETLAEQRPGLVHVSVVLHGEHGPWSNRPGFDEIGAAVTGLFAIEGTIGQPKQPPIVPICDYVAGWLGTVGVLSALRRRAAEGGSYRVVVSLTRTVLWQLALGIFDKRYAAETAGSSDEHAYVAPDTFVAETPLGTYQGITDQAVLSRTPWHFDRTILVPRGSSKPEWLTM